MGAARRQSIAVVVGAVLVATLATGWLLRRRAHIQVDTPNASVELADVEGGDTRPVFTHALAIDDRGEWWLVLSSKPIDCATALGPGQDPYAKDTARIFLEHAPATAPVEFPTEGQPHACGDPSKMPERPKTSRLRIEASSRDQVKGFLYVDQQGVVTSRKRCIDVLRTYHWVGEGTFDAPVCRRSFPWNRLP